MRAHLKHFSTVTTIILGALSLSACIMAPLSNPVTARSSGKGNATTNIGYVYPSALYLRQSLGVSKNLDLGGIVETGLNSILGVTGQYSIVNQPHGLSLAVMGGAGFGSVSTTSTDSHGNDSGKDKTSGYYFTGGGIASYKFDYVEPYVVARYNHLRIGNQFAIDNVGGSDKTLTHSNYGQVAIGATLWASDGFGVTGNYTSLLTPAGTIGFVVMGFDMRY